MTNRYIRSGATGTGDGSSWVNAYTTLSAAIAGISGGTGSGAAAVAGDQFYMSQNHAEPLISTASSSYTFPGSTYNPNVVLTCDDSITSGPVLTTVPTTPQFGTGGAAGNVIYILGSVLMSNVYMTASSGAINLTFGGSQPRQVYSGCVFACSVINSGNTGGNAYDTRFNKGTSARFYNTNGGVQIQQGTFTWEDSVAIAPGTPLQRSFVGFTSKAGIAVFSNMDLSGVTGQLCSSFGPTGLLIVKNSKLAAAQPVVPNPAATGLGSRVTILGCGAAYDGDFQCSASATVEPAVVRTGGGSTDGINLQSWKVTTNANASFVTPYDGEPFSIYNTTVGSNVNVTVEGVVLNTATMPNNDDYWMKVSYPTSTYGMSATTGKANVLASNTALVASTSAWDSQLTAVARSTAYTAGQTVKYTSQPGMVFICTTAGTSGTSDPTNGTTKADGNVVADGSAVFLAGYRFKMIATVQPSVAGSISAITRSARYSAGSNVYFDPLVTLS